MIEDLWVRVHPRLVRAYRGGLEIEDIARFCSSSSLTVNRWITKEHPSAGLRLIKLWHLLSLVEDSPEMDRLEPLNRYVSELVGFSVIVMTEACDILGQKNPQSALYALRGQSVMHPRLTLDEVQSLYEEKLDQAKKTWSQKLVSLKRQDQSYIDTELWGTISERPPAMQLATILGAALPLARHLYSDKCSPEDRSYFRTLMGYESMFELSNLLNSLCSERARSQKGQ